MSPLVYVKTHDEGSQGERYSTSSGLECGAGGRQGPVHCAVMTVRQDGIFGLWAGAAPTVLRNGTNQMCLFWAKNHMDGVLWGATLSPPSRAPSSSNLSFLPALLALSPPLPPSLPPSLPPHPFPPFPCKPAPSEGTAPS